MDLWWLPVAPIHADARSHLTELICAVHKYIPITIIFGQASKRICATKPGYVFFSVKYFLSFISKVGTLNPKITFAVIKSF